MDGVANVFEDRTGKMITTHRTFRNVQRYKRIWILDGSWAKYEAAHDRKNGRVCANAQCEGKNGRQYEGVPLAKLANAETNVAEKIFEGGEPLDVADRFFGLLNAAEFEEGAAAGFLRRETGSDVCSGLFVDVKAKLRIELEVGVTFAEQAHSDFLFRSAKDERDCTRKTFPVSDFGFQLFLPFFGERVELGFTAGFGNFPFRFNPAAVFEPVKSRIQGAMRNLKKIARNLLQALRDGVAVNGAVIHDFQDQQIERAFEEIVFFVVFWSGRRHI
jgi:hypothetical protein